MATKKTPLVLDISANISNVDANMRTVRASLQEVANGATNLGEVVERNFAKFTASEASVVQEGNAVKRMLRDIEANMRQIANAGDEASALQLFDVRAAEEAVAKSSQLVALYREAAAAAEREAASGGELAQSHREVAVALLTEANAEELNLKEKTKQLTLTQQLAGATEAEIVTSTRAAVSLGQKRAAYQQLGYQVNDIALQFASGTPVAQIFGQQIGQVTQAVSLLSNKAGGFIGFLGGPWGIGIGAAAVVLAPFVAKLFEGNDALGEAVDKLEKEARETATSERAKRAYNATLEGQIALQRDLNEELRKGILSQHQLQILELGRARAGLANLRTERANVQSDITDRQAELNRLQQALPDVTGEARGPYLAAIEQARNELERQQSRLEAIARSIGGAEENIRLAQQPLLETALEASLDRKTAAMQGLNDQLDRLRQQQRIGEGNSDIVTLLGADGSTRRGPINGISNESFIAQERAARQEYERTIARIEAEEQAERRRGRAAERQSPLATQFQRPVQGGTITGRFGEQRPGHRHSGVDLAVPVGTPVLAPAAGTIREAGARGDYGNVITINFGGKTEGKFAHLSQFNVRPGDTVDAGDIIGYSGGARGAPGAGNSQGPHLHYEIRRNGRAVDPLSGSFPTDASAAAEDAAEAQEQAAEEALERLRAFEDRLGQANERLIDARIGAAATDEERRAIEEQQLASERRARDLQIDREVADGELTAAQGRRLKLVEAAGDALEDEARRAADRQAVLDRQLDADREAIDAQGALLSLQLDFAGTLDERRRIAQQLLALELEERRRAAQRLLQSDDPEDRATGQAQLDRVDAEEPFRRRQIDRDNADPLQRYFDQLQTHLGDTNTVLKQVQADGLQGLEDDLLGVIAGTESVADAFSRMAQRILADLARIAIEQAILGLFSGLGGGGGGGGFGGFLGGSALGIGGGSSIVGQYSGPSLGFAGGGRISGPGSGTSDSILALVSNGEFVMNAESVRRYGPLIEALNAGALPGFADGGAIGSGAIDPASIRQPSLPDLRLLRPADDRDGGVTVAVTQHNNFAGGAVTQEDLARMHQVTVAAAMNGVAEQRRRAGG